MSAQISGTEGYTEEAEELFRRYESIPASENHRHVRHLLPDRPSSVLDIGSGTGRDAAWFASMGHRVVAVEPTDAMRLPAMALANPAFPGAVSKDPQVGINKGQTAVVKFTAAKPGKYLLICGFPGHALLGMYGLFEVSPSAATKPSLVIKR